MPVSPSTPDMLNDSSVVPLPVAPLFFPAKALAALLSALRLELPRLILGRTLLDSCCVPAPPLDPTRCRPTRSRSSSDHDMMLASTESISNRFESARGVLKNEMRTFVTSRRSTMFSPLVFLSCRRASMRCSFKMTADTGGSCQP